MVVVSGEEKTSQVQDIESASNGIAKTHLWDYFWAKTRWSNTEPYKLLLGRIPCYTKSKGSALRWEQFWYIGEIVRYPVFWLFCKVVQPKYSGSGVGEGSKDAIFNLSLGPWRYASFDYIFWWDYLTVESKMGSLDTKSSHQNRSKLVLLLTSSPGNLLGVID